MIISISAHLCPSHADFYLLDIFQTDKKLIAKLISEKVTAIQDTNPDMDLVYEALEQLREIMAFENNGTTSRLVDFFRLCKGMIASTEPPVTLSVNSSGSA